MPNKCECHEKGSVMRTSRTLLTTSVLALSCLTLTGATSAAAAPKAEHHSGSDSIVLNVVDATVAFHPLNTPADHGVGTLGTYEDIIYSDTTLGTKTGLGAGTLELVSKDPSNGHLIEFLDQLSQFGDGSIQFSGPFDRTALFAGTAVKQRTIGTKGRYLGYTGWNTWTLQQNPGGLGNVVAVEHIVLEKNS
jgi:hypothetical protein